MYRKGSGCVEEINLKELFRYFFSKNKLLFFIFLVILAVGCVYTFFIQKPVYKSSTTIVLSRIISNNDVGSITQSDINLNQQLVSTYREIVKSRRIINKVIKNLDLDMTYGELSGITYVEYVNDTELIKISVIHENAKLSKLIANEIVEVFCDEIVNIYDIQNISVIDKAELPKTPNNVNIPKQMVITVLLGIIVAFGIVFVIYYFDNTIKSAEEIEKRYGLPVLGTVPMRKKSKRGLN